MGSGWARGQGRRRHLDVGVLGFRLELGGETVHLLGDPLADARHLVAGQPIQVLPDRWQTAQGHPTGDHRPCRCRACLADQQEVGQGSQPPACGAPAALPPRPAMQRRLTQMLPGPADRGAAQESWQAHAEKKVAFVPTLSGGQLLRIPPYGGVTKTANSALEAPHRRGSVDGEGRKRASYICTHLIEQLGASGLALPLREHIAHESRHRKQHRMVPAHPRSTPDDAATACRRGIYTAMPCVIAERLQFVWRTRQ